jgi:hypothetical protein
MRSLIFLLVFLALFLLPAKGLHALDRATCAGLYEAISIQKKGAQFLHSRNQRLHTSPRVERVANAVHRNLGVSLQNPIEKLSAWLTHLDFLYKRSLKHPSAKERIKRIFYDRYLTKENEVPEKFFALQRRLLRERGKGNIEFTPAQRQELIATAIEDQKKSLEPWLEYLISSNSSMYPMWVKYWILEGVSQLGKFDPATGSFLSRSKGTMAPFPELNPEALAYVVDAMVKKVNGKSLAHLDDPEFLQRIDGANFGKLYGRAALRSTGKAGKERGQFLTNDGVWVRYPRGSDHKVLAKSLEGWNTGWCTAGEETARSHLSGGDFLVYYSYDQSGKPVVPRIAIRMEENDIGEIRGVASGQNLDGEIARTKVLSERLARFGPRAEQYAKRLSHMKRLTEIEIKHSDNQPLTREELRFLYEIDEKIIGFGQSFDNADPRVREIISARDQRADLVKLFDLKLKPEEVSLTKKEALSGSSKFHLGDIKIGRYDFLEVTETLPFPETMNGNISLELSAVPAEKIHLPRSLKGDIFLQDTELAKNLIIPDPFKGNITLRGTSAPDVILPKTFEGRLDLSRLGSLEGVEIPEDMKGSLILPSSLKSAKGLKLPKGVTFYVGPEDIER